MPGRTIPKVSPHSREKSGAIAVRLDIQPSDHARLERCAAERGLSRSSYARMSLLRQIREDEIAIKAHQPTG